MSQDFNLQVVQQTLLLSGEVTFANAEEVLAKSLAQFKNLNSIQIDFSGLTVSRSIVLALILEWIKYAKQRNLAIQFSHLPEDLMAIAKVSGIDRLMTLSS